MPRSLGFSIVVAVSMMLACVTACRTSNPELRVLGVHDETRHQVVFVQVTNPEGSSMRLTKLEHSFAADGATVSEGEVALARDVPAGAAVVVEVPLDTPSEKPLTLSGKLTAELDQIVRIFTVSARIDPSELATSN
jgi:hypothetical protein